MPNAVRYWALLGIALSSACSSSTPPAPGAGSGDPAPLACAAPPPAAGTVPRLQRQGRWLVDHHGRVVLIHGVNAVWKLDPYVPPDAPDGFRAEDAAWLAEHGFNSARIGTLWVGVSPDAPGQVKADYLAAWDRIVGQLAAQKIWMLFDFHQDMLGHVYQGEGVPDWAVEPIIGTTTELLGPPSFGFPFNYFTPQVSEAFDNLWAENGPVRDGLRDAWIGVARHWKDQPYSMGYDLLNEPWPGLEYPLCFNPLLGCESHERDELQPFFGHVREGIRAVDPHNLIWYEPGPLISTGAPAQGFAAVPGESQLGYSFHYYCPLNTLANSAQLGLVDTLPFGPQDTCESFGNNTFAQARLQADKMQGVELLTEFGATDELPVIAEVTAQADAALVGWHYWQYKNFQDPTTESQGSSAQSLFADDSDLSTVKVEKLKLLERAYPQATAGTPLELSFNPETAELLYRYTAGPASAPTEVHVPKIHYPDGYVVEVSGAKVISLPGASPLKLQNLACTGEVVLRLRRP